MADDEWSAVSRFYDDLLNLEPSLSKRCVTRNTWLLAITVAKEGNNAYEALTDEPVPAIARLGRTYRCRPKPP